MELKSVFERYNIEIRNKDEDPLFNARDVARYIGDSNHYTRKLKKLNPKDIIYMTTIDNSNREVETPFLTEVGMYRYLMQANTREAEKFQYEIYEKMVEWRKQLISDEMLKNRILTGKLESSINNNQNMILGEFQRNLDTSPEDLANFYIAKYFASSSISDRNSDFCRESLSPECIKLIIKIAGSYYYRAQSELPEFREKVEKIIDNQKNLLKNNTIGKK